jgi:hypothetical protein
MQSYKIILWHKTSSRLNQLMDGWIDQSTVKLCSELSEFTMDQFTPAVKAMDHEQSNQSCCKLQ